MPGLTVSWYQLTYLDNLFTTGLLEITYPARHRSGAAGGRAGSAERQTKGLAVL